MSPRRSTFLLSATLCLPAGSAAGREGPPPEVAAPEAPATVASDGAPTLAALLGTLGLDALAVDMYLKIEGIEGESTAAGAGHEDWIVIESFAWGGRRPSPSSTGRTRQRGAATFSDVSVVKTVDAASPNLYLACAQGKHFPKAEIHLVSATDERVPYMVYELENVMITSVSVSHSSGHDVPMEEVTLNYGKITWEYTPGDGRAAGGSIRKSWDLIANQAG